MLKKLLEDLVSGKHDRLPMTEAAQEVEEETPKVSKEVATEILLDSMNTAEMHRQPKLDSRS